MLVAEIDADARLGPLAAVVLAGPVREAVDEAGLVPLERAVADRYGRRGEAPGLRLEPGRPGAPAALLVLADELLGRLVGGELFVLWELEIVHLSLALQPVNSI